MSTIVKKESYDDESYQFQSDNETDSETEEISNKIEKKIFKKVLKNSMVNNDIYQCPFLKQKNLLQQNYNFLESSTFISENGNMINLELELPGVDINGIILNFENSYLTITAEKKRIYQANGSMGNFKRHEKSNGIYKRIFNFNLSNVDKQSIKARLIDGLLLITINKIL